MSLSVSRWPPSGGYPGYARGDVSPGDRLKAATTLIGMLPGTNS